MIKYTKSFLYACLVLLILGCIACKRETRQDTSQVCTLNKQLQTSVEAEEKPVTCVVIDDKALAAFTKQKVTAAYCVAMGAS